MLSELGKVGASSYLWVLWVLWLSIGWAMNAYWYVINVNCGETLDILAFARILSRWLGGNTLWFQLSGWHPASHVAFETHPLGPCNFLLHSCLNCLVHDALPVECSLKSSYQLSIYTHWNFRLFKTHFFFFNPCMVFCCCCSKLLQD